MNKIGKMEGQKKLKQYNELSRKERKRFKDMVLTRYEEYINSDANGRKQIKLQILREYGLVDNASNRQRILWLIGNEKRRRERKNKVSIKHRSVKHRNRFSDIKRKAIEDFIIENGLHTDYLEADANNENYKKINIIKKILNEFEIKNCDKNNSKIRRLLLHTTFKPWSEEEEQALEELLCENIDTTVWNKSGGNKKIRQTRKQIMVKFKEQFPANEHNDYDIMYKMSLIVCKIKKSIIPKPIRVKSKKSRSIETRQIKPVQQSVSKIVGEEMQLDNINKKPNNQLTKEQNSIAYSDELLPFRYDENLFNFDDSENFHDFNDLEISSITPKLTGARQIKPIQQATFQVIKKQIQFDNAIGRIENNYNDLFPQVNPQLQISIDPFLLEDQFQEIVDFSDCSDWKNSPDFNNSENSYSL